MNGTYSRKCLAFILALLVRCAEEIERFAPDIVQANGARTVKYGAAAKILVGSKPSWTLIYRNIDVPSFWNQKKLSVAAYRHIFMPKWMG